MISDIRTTDDDEVAVATGERYDVPRVLETAFRLLDAYAAFAAARGLEAPYTLSTPKPPRSDDDPILRLLKESGLPFRLPYGRHTSRLIGVLVAKEREAYDAGGMRHAIEAPPFRFDLYPLGHEPLYANFGLCREKGLESPWVTCEGGPGTGLDVAPHIRVHRHLPERAGAEASEPRPGRDYRLLRPHKRILEEFLATQAGLGIAWEPGGADTVLIRFPHARFGAGIGDIRIAVLRAGGD